MSIYILLLEWGGTRWDRTRWDAMRWNEMKWDEMRLDAAEATWPAEDTTNSGENCGYTLFFWQLFCPFAMVQVVVVVLLFFNGPVDVTPLGVIVNTIISRCDTIGSRRHLDISSRGGIGIGDRPVMSDRSRMSFGRHTFIPRLSSQIRGIRMPVSFMMIVLRMRVIPSHSIITVKHTHRQRNGKRRGTETVTEKSPGWTLPLSVMLLLEEKKIKKKTMIKRK